MKNQKEGGHLLSKIHQIGGRIFSRILKENGIEINPAQGRIMFVLWKNDGISIRELSEKTSLGKSTLTSMLDRLESSGYIKRVAAKDDRRKIIIQRTAKDRAYQELYIKVSRDMTEIFYRDFPDPEIIEFESYLKRIYDNLTEYDRGHS